MQIVRSVLLVAACMAASVSHAALLWQGGIDQASKGAAAFITSPQGKVAGLVYGLDPVATGWKLNRQAGTLVQQPFPFQGGYSPLRSPSAYGISSSPNKVAVIDVPANVKVPGRSSELPARIVEPVAKRTLARSLVKLVPVLGTAYQLGELLDDLGVIFRDGQWYQEQEADPNENPQSDGNQYGVYFWGGQWAPLPHGLTKQGACKWWGTVADGGTYSASFYLSGDKCVRTAPVYQTFDIVSRPLNGCPSGHFWNGTSCVPTLPSSEVPISEDQVISKVEQQALPDRLVSIFNGLPNESGVIDTVAREIKDDPEDAEFRWPSALQIPSSTIQVGDPVTTTTTNPDGSTVTTTTTTTATTNGNRIDFVTKTETTTRDSQGNQTSTTTTTTNPSQPNNPNSPQQEDLECGLPGTPPCKIDETGTPSPPEDDGENTFKGLIPNCLKQDWRSCFPELPNINWSFSLPSGCGPIPVPFGKYGFSEVNICPWQGMIHDLMSMLWAAAGLFGAIGILSGRRNSEA